MYSLADNGLFHARFCAALFCVTFAIFGQAVGQDAYSQFTQNTTPPRYPRTYAPNKSALPVRPAVVVREPIPLPAEIAAWWQPMVNQPIDDAKNAMPVTLDSLLVATLNHSAQVRVFSNLPLIRETAITEAQAAFDWHGFLDTKWHDISEPVGSVLTTGGPSRFNDHEWTMSTGARRRNLSGGRVEFGQELGYQKTNSRFFVPNPQGTSRLTLSYTQPLLRGSGKCYNQSLIVLAELDTAIAKEEFVRQLQAHLLEVTRAYWALYLERGAYLQKNRLYQRADDVLASLEAREDFDTPTYLVLKARAAVDARRAEIQRARMAVRNAEARIQSLINDPAFCGNFQIELVPQDLPNEHPVLIDMCHSMTTAMRTRPEITQSLKQIKASSVRLNMSKNELLPVLDFVMETYVSGLAGDGDIALASRERFSGDPSYTAGLQFEVPIGNRAAKARNQRRALELRQLRDQFKTTIETLRLEVSVAVRELETSFREISTKRVSLIAANQELSYLNARWPDLARRAGSTGVVLDDLLSAQERLNRAEFEFLRAQMSYSLSLTNHRRAIGTLLQHEQVQFTRSGDCDCLPVISPIKPTASGHANRRY